MIRQPRSSGAWAISPAFADRAGAGEAVEREVLEAHAAPSSDRERAAATARPFDFDVRSITGSIARGDELAFETLYRACFDEAFEIARRATRRDEAFCLDVVQDAMMKTAKRIPTLDGASELRAWLRAVVCHAAIDRIRSDSRRRSRELERPTRDMGRVNQDLLDRVRAELGRLTPEERRLLSLRFGLDRTLDAVGAGAGITGNAAHGKIRRALGQLRRALMEDSA